MSPKEPPMRIGLSCDLKDAVTPKQDDPEDALEEYDSPATVAFIISSLEARGHSVIRLGGGREFLDNIRREPVDIVFNIAEGRGNYRSREAQIPAILEMLDIPYTGSDPQCLSICLDKPTTKKLVAADGINTPGWLVIADGAEIRHQDWDKIAFPAIIKPAYEGSSKGIRLDSVVSSPEQAIQALPKLLKYYQQPVMLEEFIDGDEVTVGIVGNTPPKIVGQMRILPRKKEGHFVYSLEVKRDYLNRVDYECPARLGEKITDELASASLKAFRALGCRDFARVDFRISPEGKVYFIEINPLPGLGNYSDLVIMAVKMGWTHQGLIGAVFEAALERYPSCVHTA
jgi:D-alanine-D-alanine ligase